MPRIKYSDTDISESKLGIIESVNLIAASYGRQGFSLTLRQIYYRFVATDSFPDDRTWRYVHDTGKWVRDANGTKNAEPNYKWIGEIINDGRMAGLIDWNAIEDRTRELDGNNHWDAPQDVIAACANQYMIDKWQEQPFRPEVWVEKDALEDVIGQVAKRMDVNFFSCRGYTSQTAMWDAGRRLKLIAEEGATPVILHLGDHDPSGIDMSRDIEDRIRLFMEDEGEKLEFKRIALNMPQVRQYRPPPNPAKITDSRANKYIAVHGAESWELDALDPTVLTSLIEKELKPYRDEKIFKKFKAKEDGEKSQLIAVSERWDDVIDIL